MRPWMSIALAACNVAPRPAAPSVDPAEIIERLDHLEQRLQAVQRGVEDCGRADPPPAPPPPQGEVRCVPADLISDLTEPTHTHPGYRTLLHRGADGSFDGYRLSGIRSGSAVARLGLKSGDIVHQVDDVPLSSVQAALEVYDRLSGADPAFVTLDLTRRGAPYRLLLQLKGCDTDSARR